MIEHDSEALLTFFKALADANRLKIVGLLAQQDLSVEQIAGMLGVHASTVSHHLSKLAKTGLVSARAEGYYSIYHLETKALEGLSKSLLQREAFSAAAEDVDVDAYDRRVLKGYLTPEGRIRSFPGQQKKLEVILRHVIQSFEPGMRYTEKQVNEILKRFTDDISGLRRDLVDHQMLGRQTDGREYWLITEKG